MKVPESFVKGRKFIIQEYLKEKEIASGVNIFTIVANRTGFSERWVRSVVNEFRKYSS